MKKTTQISTCVEMGFDPDFAHYALENNNNNLELAIDYMMKNTWKNPVKKIEKIVPRLEEKFIERIELDCSLERVIRVNCGDVLCCVLYSTILPTKGTKFFDILVNDNTDIDKHGRIFIDRPGHLFEKILDCLRYHVKDIPKDSNFLDELKFYGLFDFSFHLEYELLMKESIIETKSMKYICNTSQVLWNTSALGGFTTNIDRLGVVLLRNCHKPQWNNGKCMALTFFKNLTAKWEVEICSITNRQICVGLTTSSRPSYYQNDICIRMDGKCYGGVQPIGKTGVKGRFGGVGDVICVQMDFPKNVVTFSINGVAKYTGSIRNGTLYYPCVHLYHNNDSVLLLK